MISSGRIHVLDSAWGTFLQKTGLQDSDDPELRMCRGFSIPLLLAVLFLLSFNAIAQNMLQNGAFNSDIFGSSLTPEPWYVCDSIESTPEVHVEYIRQGISYFSHDSSTFVLLRVREDATSEHMQTPLIRPMVKDYCYKLSVDLRHTYGGSSMGTFTHPVLFQIWGGLTYCSQDELLFESELINNPEWQRYSFTFHVKQNDYPYLYIEAVWDTINYSQEVYRGIIFLDNIELLPVREVLPVMNHTDVYYRIDPGLELQAVDGVTYDWEPDWAVEQDGLQQITMTAYSEQIDVTVLDADGCPTYESFMITYHCDTVFPSKTLEEAAIYFKFDSPVILPGPTGKEYNWQPAENLDLSDEQNPIVIAYTEFVDLNFINNYDCELNKRYQVLINCDTIYPDKQIFVLDTLLTDYSSVDLVPRYLQSAAHWYPEEEVTCVNCQTQTVRPVSSMVYSVDLTDQFGCEHTEHFIVNKKLVIPNVFTPNNDGYNDQFIIMGLPKNASIAIFRKNGTMVYQNTNYGYAGNGNSEQWWDGLNVETGNYWYVLKLPNAREIKGFIFVKR